MKTIVLYKSSTGFTKQYAEWIAEELKCDIFDVKKISKDTIDTYEHVIFGGWIMGNMIVGLDQVRKLSPKKLTIFAVGSSLHSEELVNTIKEINHIESEELYYFEGGFKFTKLKFPVRMMLKAMKKSVMKKEKKTEQDEYMVKVLGTNFDNSDKKNINALLASVK